MRDIPIFTTRGGVASLILREVPTKQTAYIHLISVISPDELLAECVQFCRAAGAEEIYATGDPILEHYPHHTTLCAMRGSVADMGEAELSLFPVTEKTWPDFCRIYNEKMMGVPTANTLRLLDWEEYEKDAYFVHRDGELQGIGIVREDQLLAIASCQKGAGRAVLSALCKALTGEKIELSVAENNLPAMALYTRCGFIKTGEIARWYKIL